MKCTSGGIGFTENGFQWGKAPDAVAKFVRRRWRSIWPTEPEFTWMTSAALPGTVIAGATPQH